MNAAKTGFHGLAWVGAVLLGALLVLCPSSAYAGNVWIDNFDGDEQTFFSFDGTPSNPDGSVAVTSTGSTVIGSERELEIFIDAPVLPFSAAGRVGGAEELLQLATFGDSGTRTTLLYDGDGSGLGGIDLTDLGNNDAILFGFEGLDTGDGTTMMVGIEVVGASGTAVYSGPDSLISASNVPFEHALLFQDFSNASALSSAQSITITLNSSSPPMPNVDFQLDYVLAGAVQPVPEPSTLLLLCAAAFAGLLTITRRR